MAASVRIEDEAFADTRYDELAAYAGLQDADHARGKMAWLWRQCTIEQTHFLPAFVVRKHLGPDGVDALVRARLGVAVDGDRVRIRGTKGRIEWLQKLRENGKKGGRPPRVRAKPSGSAVAKPSGISELNPPAPAPAPAPAPKKPEAVPSGQQAVIADFHDRYLKAYGTKPAWSPKEIGIVSRLVKQNGDAEVRRRIAILFDSPPSWLAPPYDVGTLSQHFNKLVVGPAQTIFQPRNQIG